MTGLPLRARLKGLSHEERTALCLAFLRQQIGRLLGGLEGEDVDPDLGFVAAGLDSLRLTELREAIARAFELEVRATLAFEEPTPRKLAQRLAAMSGEDAASVADENPIARKEPGRQAAEEIAIIGAAGRFAGRASDLDGLWDLLSREESAVSEVPKDRFDLDEWFDEDPATPGKTHIRHGGFLAGSLKDFDARRFRIAPREADELDPHQRLLLEATAEALEDAGESAATLARKRVGVFIGTRASEYYDSQCQHRARDAGPYYATGNAVSTAAGRIAFTFDFRGPCFALDTACSGSLVALHCAVQSLRRGECDYAIAGGVNTLVDPVSFVALGKAQMLSPKGRCATFSADADGYVRAEGVGILLLCRKALAEAERARIRALILGTAINQDGASGGLTVPSGPAQEAVLRAALDDAGLAPASVDWIEAHGTGTVLGDPIEVQALDRVFAADRQPGRPLRIGSVKTNLGHAEAAAGIAGLLKGVLAIEHEQIPAHLVSGSKNPHIDWDQSCVHVQTTARPWPREAGRRRIMGVSSFGFSGTNAHVLLGECQVVQEADANPRPRLLVLSAATAEGLEAAAKSLADGPARGSLAGAERSLFAARAAERERLALVVPSEATLAEALLALSQAERDSEAGRSRALLKRGRAAQRPLRVAFAFGGQGSQRPHMGESLAKALASFGQQRAQLQSIARAHGDDLDALASDAAGLQRTRAAQPTIVAHQLALAQWLIDAGIEPALVFGHSVGEIAAAAIAGVFTAEVAYGLAVRRGELIEAKVPPGAMRAVLAGEAALKPFLRESAGLIALAAINADELCTLSGPTADLDRMAARLQAAGIASTPLDVSHAFHSAALDPVLEPLREALSALPFAPAKRRFLSTLRNDLGAKNPASPEYWVRQMRGQVDFREALHALKTHEIDLVIEIGGRSVLGPLARRTRATRDLPWISLALAGEDEVEALLAALADLYVRGLFFDAERLLELRCVPPAALPRSPRRGSPHWLGRLSPAAAKARTPASGGGLHPILQAEVAVADDPPGRRRFQGILAEADPLFADHCALGRPLFPLAGLIDLGLSALRAMEAPLCLQSFAVREPLWLDQGALRFEVRCDPDDLRIFAAPPSQPFLWPARSRPLRPSHALQQAPAPPPPEDAVSLAAADALLDRLFQRGLFYGPAFRALKAFVRPEDHRLIAALELPDAALAHPGAAAGPRGFVVSPSLLDGAFQAAAALLPDDGRLWLPLSVGRIEVFGPLGQKATAELLRLDATSKEQHRLDLRLFDAAGRLCLLLTDFTLVPADHLGQASEAAGLFHRLRFERALPPKIPSALREALLIGPFPDALTNALREHFAVQACLDLPSEDSATEIDRALAAATAPLEKDAVILLAPTRWLATDPAIGLEQSFQILAALARQGHASGRWPMLIALEVQGAKTSPADPAPVPEFAARAGLLASLAQECPAFSLAQLDHLESAAPADLAAAIAREASAKDAGLRRALRGTEHFRGRLCPFGESLRIALPSEAFAIRVREYGDAQAWECIAIPSFQTPPPGFAVIEVSAAGLNWKDLLHARGRLAAFAAERGIRRPVDQPLGLEFAGRIKASAVGSAYAPGDLVFGFAEGALASEILVPEHQFCPQPAAFSASQTAGLPTVAATALYALEDLGQLQSGQRVLIHTAAGGVGQAALQVARRRGAEIFATASREKHEALRAQGLEQLFDSRDDRFAAEILAATGGAGVDLILDPLGGRLVPLSLPLLAKGGTYVQLAKLDIPSQEEVQRERPDIRWEVFDLADRFAEDPALAGQLLRRLATGLADQSLAPLATRVFPVAEIRLAAEAFGRGRHRGKIVVDFAPRARGLAVQKATSTLLTGGAGALGRAFSEELFARGATTLYWWGRRAPDPDTTAWIESHRKAGRTIEVLVPQGPWPPALAALKERAAAAGHPIRSVAHFAGVLEDELLIHQDRPARERVFAPKLNLAQALVRAFAGEPLDWMILWGSLSGTLGVPGQTAYAAANAGLEALAEQARRAEIPALSVVLGPIKDRGMAAGLAPRERARIEARGVRFLPFERVLKALDQALELGSSAVVIADLPAQIAAATPKRTEAPLSPAASQTIASRAALLAFPSPQRAGFLVQALDHALAEVLGFGESTGLEEDQSFSQLGLDSLAAVDLKARLESELDLVLPSTLFFDHPSLRALSQFLLDTLGLEETAEGEPVPQATEPSAAPSLADDDLAAELRAQLERLRAARQALSDDDGE